MGVFIILSLSYIAGSSTEFFDDLKLFRALCPSLITRKRDSAEKCAAPEVDAHMTLFDFVDRKVKSKRQDDDGDRDDRPRRHDTYNEDFAEKSDE